MNVNRTYASFVDAIHKGEVLADFRHIGGDIKQLPRGFRSRDWEIPSYDFGYLLDEKHPEFLGAHRFKGAANKAVKMMTGEGHSPGDPAPMAPSAYVLHYLGLWRIVTATVQPAPAGTPYTFDTHFGIDAFTWYPDVRRWIAKTNKREWAIPMPALCTALLQNPEITFKMADDPSIGAINRRQRTRGRKALKPTCIVRVIHLHKVEKIGERLRGPSNGSTHASPIPHDRAPHGYCRTYKRTGVTKWYPGPIKVRGGKEAAPPVDYIVKP